MRIFARALFCILFTAFEFSVRQICAIRSLEEARVIRQDIRGNDLGRSYDEKEDTDLAVQA